MIRMDESGPPDRRDIFYKSGPERIQSEANSLLVCLWIKAA